jgi:catechol-2,3-dioxygenase
MGSSFPCLNRREFLTGSSLSMALIAAHDGAAAGKPGDTPSQRKRKESLPRIVSLELLTSAPLAQMKAFYHQSLGLRVLDESSNRLTISAGESPITFVQGESAQERPFYHFAFNIPENKVLAARAWQRKRSLLLPIPARLRDPQYPDDVVNYSHWNAHSLFFLDPGGNVVEYIARHDLKNRASGAFSSKDILYVSEIGLIVDDVLASATVLREVVGLEQYRGGSDQFTALGDEHGLLLVMKRGRILNFSETSKEKAAQVFQTGAHVRGVKQAQYRFPAFPYEIHVEV